MNRTARGAVQGVVLSGGGAYAAYEVGVLKGLAAGQSCVTADEPFDPTVVTGTSAGAFNAAALLSSRASTLAGAVAELEGIWLNQLAEQRGAFWNGVYRNRLDVREWFGPDGGIATAVRDAAVVANGALQRAAHLLTGSREPVTRRALEFIDLTMFISVAPFENAVRRTVHADAVRASGRQLRIAATNWDTGDLRVFTNADMDADTAALAVLASAAIPGFFPPVRIGSDWFVDGGVLMNTPLLPAIEAGADVLHVIYLDPPVKNIRRDRLDNLISAFERVLLLARGDLIERDIATAANVNREIETRAHLARQPAAAPVKPLMGRTGAPRRRLVIHSYHPAEDLGGITGILALDRDHIASLIEAGVRTARTHDCATAGCVLG